MLGRFFWSSTSDRIGRKNTYSIFFLLGAVLYILIPTFGNMGSTVLFIITFCIIISMYGGAFATVPAYLKDMFGVMQVGAIHGRLLVAWSLAALFGPSLINYLRAYQIESVMLPPAEAYSFTMYIMAGLLIIGFVCNILITPVKEKFHHHEV
jgi:MFS family permease